MTEAGHRVGVSADETLRVLRDWNDLVWGRCDWGRVPEFAGPEYTRHEPNGTRTVAAEDLAREIRGRYSEPVRFDYVAFAEDDMAFVTWTMLDRPGGPISGVQAYRVAGGKLVETWISAMPAVVWPSPPPIGEGDPEANKRLLCRWYEEMYEQRRFEELAPQLCGPVFTRHEASGTFDVTAEEHGARLATAVAARDAEVGATAMISAYRVFAAGDRVGVIADSGRTGSYVQTWRVENTKFVESWWAGFASVSWDLSQGGSE